MDKIVGPYDKEIKELNKKLDDILGFCHEFEQILYGFYVRFIVEND